MPNLYSPASPYSAKVRMAAAYAGIAAGAGAGRHQRRPDGTHRRQSARQDPDAGHRRRQGDLRQPRDHAISEPRSRASSSRAIRPSGPKPSAWKRWPTAFAIALLAIVYERRFRPEEKVHQPWIDRQWEKVAARSRPCSTPTRRSCGKKIHVGHIALRAVLGYLDLRFAGKWEKGRGKLKRWAARFDEKFPELKALLPVRGAIGRARNKKSRTRARLFSCIDLIRIRTSCQCRTCTRWSSSSTSRVPLAGRERLVPKSV